MANIIELPTIPGLERLEEAKPTIPGLEVSPAIPGLEPTAFPTGEPTIPGLEQLREERTTLSRIFGFPKEDKRSAFWKAMDLLQKPLYATVGGAREILNAAQEDRKADVLNEMWKGWSLEEKETWKDVLNDVGVQGLPSTIGGLAMDVVFDPLNFLFGAGLISKTPKGLKAIEKISSFAGKIGDYVPYQKIPGLVGAEKVLRTLFIPRTGIKTTAEYAKETGIKSFDELKYLFGKEGDHLALKEIDDMADMAKRAQGLDADEWASIIDYIESDMLALRNADEFEKSVGELIRLGEIDTPIGEVFTFAHKRPLRKELSEAGLKLADEIKTKLDDWYKEEKGLGILSERRKMTGYFPRRPTEELRELIKIKADNLIETGKIDSGAHQNIMSFLKRRKLHEFTTAELNQLADMFGLHIGKEGRFFLEDPFLSMAIRGVEHAKALTREKFYNNTLEAFGVYGTFKSRDELIRHITGKINPLDQMKKRTMELKGETYVPRETMINPDEYVFVPHRRSKMKDISEARKVLETAETGDEVRAALSTMELLSRDSIPVRTLLQNIDALPQAELGFDMLKDQLAHIEKVAPDWAKEMFEESIKKNLDKLRPGGVEGFFLPNNVAKELLRADSKISALDALEDTIGKGWDTIQNFLKKQMLLSPSYHVRNVMGGNMWNSYLGGLPMSKFLYPVSWTKAIGTMRGKGDDALLEAARKYGVLNQGWAAADIQATNVFKKVRKWSKTDPEKLNKFEKTWHVKIPYTKIPLNPVKLADVAGDLNLKFGTQVENISRMIFFDHKVGEFAKQIGTKYDDMEAVYRAAAIQTKKYLFDYSELTAIEKKLFKRILPFYTWTRKNLPLQIQGLVTKPHKFARAAKLVRGGPEALADIFDWDPVKEGPNDAYVSEWLKEGAAIPIRKNKEGQYEYFMLGNWLPAAELYTRLSSPGLMGESFMDMLSPMIKQPWEQLANKSFFFENELERVPGERGVFLGYPARRRTINVLRSFRVLNELNKLGLDIQPGATEKWEERIEDLKLPSDTAKALSVLIGKLYPFEETKGQRTYRYNIEKKLRELKAKRNYFFRQRKWKEFDKANELIYEEMNKLYK